MIISMILLHAASVADAAAVVKRFLLYYNNKDNHCKEREK